MTKKSVFIKASTCHILCRNLFLRYKKTNESVKSMFYLYYLKSFDLISPHPSWGGGDTFETILTSLPIKRRERDFAIIHIRVLFSFCAD